MGKISREVLLHIPKSNYAYGYDKDTLHIRLRSKKGEVKNATLRIGDQYIWDEGGAGGGNLNESGRGWIGSFNISMEKEIETEFFDYWFCEYKPPTKRSRYSFIIEGDQDKFLFTEKGIDKLNGEDDEDKLCNVSSFFGYSYLNKIDIPKVPEWVKETIWYQIFPDRFSNGDYSINPPNVRPWGSIPTAENFMGGDLQGIINHLDYLQDLGITGIYLCPITEGNTNHRYDTIDYMKINKYLGNKETLKKLVGEAHKRGIKIMLDAVFNHIGYYSKQWQDVIKNKENSRYKDWFYIKDINKVDTPLEKINIRNIPYETFGCVPEMPKLNTENEEVIEHLIEVGRYWIREFDIDAWRLDVSNEVDHSFWRKFRQEVKKIKPEIYILGEIWHNSLPWLMGDQFDSVMNYPLADAMRDFFCTNVIDAKQFKYMLNNVFISYPRQINEVAFNLLGSHDTTRILTFAEGNIKKFKLAYLFMFIETGCPCIYYGDEIGMQGNQNEISHMNRQCMIWDEEKQNKDILDFMKKIIKLRKENKEFKFVLNKWIVCDEEKELIILKKEEVTIIINNSDKKIDIELPDYLKNREVEDLFNNLKLSLNKNLILKPYDYLIIK